ncbi:uncharacterized protein LOC133199160 [Saccostrea echinata]|uniref:uncharacterized protein LOC133199160 n=1 Tax=Saccostrea echinata TaxID=191078 RepID=UPI002A818C49|nr:uncharacterized protein LOC133199160 [Saccostrea echinata]
MDGNFYQNLLFNNADYNYSATGSVQQSTSYLPQNSSKTCDYNCICCARFHVGNPCPCNASKTSIGTQTDLEVPQGLDSEQFWKRGTYEHSILQKSVHDVVQKYNLSGKTDASWEQATSEIMTSFTKDMDQTQSNRQKIQQRMRKAIYWIKFYGKKKTEAIKDGQKSVYRFLCKSRKRRANTTETSTLERTHASVLEDGLLACTTSRVINGIKGLSPLCLLSVFNMVAGFVPDYLHNVCQGVTRQFTSLWLDTHNKGKPFYIGRQWEELDRKLLKLKPPFEITRRPRSLSTRRFWKASEWRAFLIFYALIILRSILPQQYVNHFFLLVFAIYTLLQSSVTLDEVDCAERALRKFVQQVGELGADNRGAENLDDSTPPTAIHPSDDDDSSDSDVPLSAYTKKGKKSTRSKHATN